MRNEFLDTLRITQLEVVNRRQVAVQDHAAWEQEGVGIVHARRRQIADAQEVAEAFATCEPVLVETRDRQRVGHVDLVNEGLHAVDDLLHLRQPLAVDGRVRIQVDG